MRFRDVEAEDNCARPVDLVPEPGAYSTLILEGLNSYEALQSAGRTLDRREMDKAVSGLFAQFDLLNSKGMSLPVRILRFCATRW